jgi:hypothetical protein
MVSVDTEASRRRQATTGIAGRGTRGNITQRGVGAGPWARRPQDGRSAGPALMSLWRFRLWYPFLWMLGTLRRTLAVPAGLLIVLLTMGVALPAALHGDAKDDLCEAVGQGVVSHHRLQAASDASTSQHCGICHWLRSLRVFQTDPAQPLPRLVPSARAVARPASAARRLVVSSLPARAPPA